MFDLSNNLRDPMMCMDCEGCVCVCELCVCVCEVCVCVYVHSFTVEKLGKNNSMYVYVSSVACMRVIHTIKNL